MNSACELTSVLCHYCFSFSNIQLALKRVSTEAPPGHGLSLFEGLFGWDTRRLETHKVSLWTWPFYSGIQPIRIFH